jgi:hypothetical protein
MKNTGLIATFMLILIAGLFAISSSFSVSAASVAKPTRTPTPTPKPPCNCTGPILTCKDFKNKKAAQTCFNYCKKQGYGDIFQLDPDKNKKVCEKVKKKKAGACDPSYPTVCIPPKPPDLDCKDISYRNFKVLPPDPHKFDGDHDGWGCESW